MKKNLIGGNWVEGASATKNINPSDISDTIDEFAAADAAQVNQAIDAAAEAGKTWAHSTPQQRFDLLDKAGELILARRQELGTLLSREEGKVLAEGIGEATRAGHIFKFMAGEALRIEGEARASARPGIETYITREPVGVVGLITPWNFPIAIPAWKIAPALAHGNTVVVKPADLVPASTHAIAEILVEAGLPAGVLNLTMGPGRVVGEALVNSPKVKAISFTGSVGTGMSIAQKAVASGKKVQTEMGGKNPLIVLDDADLENAVNSALNGAFFSTGQRCTACSRLIVTAGIYDKFVARMKEKMAALKIGHALEAGIDIGPVVDQKQLDQDLKYIEIGQKESGSLVGGGLVERPTKGFFLAPALFTDTTNQMQINREEVFGPVASIIRVKDYEEALAVANDTEFGLSAGICTSSLKYATHFRRHSQAGMVMVNLSTAGVDYHVPFGGTKGSSYGSREQGRYAQEFYSTVKTAYSYAL
ncbi:aldehyde dehydrogenase family protein [Lacibacterium aquatile]|uniref:Aldehyde dehydrogenase family protein n=1 Tax=Lacibacterium aquatile TaxID=1168082 RepID=A0ABW5DRT7_9PROT